jgi:hypothetical protein
MQNALLMAIAILILSLSGCADREELCVDCDTPPPPPDAAAVSGRILDEESVPVANAQVALLDPESRDIAAQTTSGEDGSFDLGLVEPGQWILSVNALGYEAASQRLELVGGQDLTDLTFVLEAIAVAEAFHETFTHTFELTFGIGWHVGGDFNQGCIMPGVTCQAIGFPNPNVEFNVSEVDGAPAATIVIEETWIPNSGICAKAIAIDVYAPENDGGPSFDNPHYWTNYPSDEWSTTSPVVMVIPGSDPSNPQALDSTERAEKNDGEPIEADGDWLVRNFPPGAGLTNLPADAHCFTDQKMDVFFTVFYLDPAPAGFSARPDA